jgi:hypothetical protein
MEKIFFTFVLIYFLTNLLSFPLSSLYLFPLSLLCLPSPFFLLTRFLSPQISRPTASIRFFLLQTKVTLQKAIKRPSSLYTFHVTFFHSVAQNAMTKFPLTRLCCDHHMCYFVFLSLTIRISLYYHTIHNLHLQSRRKNISFDLSPDRAFEVAR